MFSGNSANKRHKNQAKVTVQTVGAPAFDGSVYLVLGDRLIDLLNDERRFIPVLRDSDGKTLILAKDQIISIIEREVPPGAESAPPAEEFDDTVSAIGAPPLQGDDMAADDTDAGDAGDSEAEAAEDAAARKKDKATADRQKPDGKRFDPYELLRVARDAPVDEIRNAYKKRIKAVHPDSVAALGLDDEQSNAALVATQKLNYAYRKIMSERESVAGAD